MPRAWSKRLLALAMPALLAGCALDTSSYVLVSPDHAISLARYQSWFWQDQLYVDVTALHLPECQGGGRIEQVPRDAELILYRAPEEYPEPLFILRLDERYYAVSTQSCRMQTFAQPPADPGVELGRFAERDGGFRFLPTTPMDS
jgi:hypothetical protein